MEKKGRLAGKPNETARRRFSSCQFFTLLCFLSFCIICVLVVALSYNWPTYQQPDNLVNMTIEQQPTYSTEKTDSTEKNFSDILWISISAIILVLGLAVFLLMRLARKKEEVLKTLGYYLAISRSTCEVSYRRMPYILPVLVLIITRFHSLKSQPFHKVIFVLLICLPYRF